MGGTAVGAKGLKSLSFME